MPINKSSVAIEGGIEIGGPFPITDRPKDNHNLKDTYSRLWFAGYRASKDIGRGRQGFLKVSNM